MEEIITFENLPRAVGQLLAKVEGLERLLKAAPPASITENQSEYVTVEEAIVILRGTVTARTLYNWRYEGRIAYSKVGRKLLFKRTDLEALISDGHTDTLAEREQKLAERSKELLREAVNRKRK